jgi:hypothetical protein
VSALTHRTVWPTLAWISAGSKATFFIVTVVPVAEDGADVAELEADELDEVLELELDPQAVRAAAVQRTRSRRERMD